jgi:hypothetical protein
MLAHKTSSKASLLLIHSMNRAVTFGRIFIGNMDTREQNFKCLQPILNYKNVRATACTSPQSTTCHKNNFVPVEKRTLFLHPGTILFMLVPSVRKLVDNQSKKNTPNFIFSTPKR